MTDTMDITDIPRQGRPSDQPPPVGLNVFILKGVVGDVSTGTIFKGVTPFWIADILRLALIVLLPVIVLFLPNQMGGLGH